MHYPMTVEINGVMEINVEINGVRNRYHVLGAFLEVSLSFPVPVV